MALRYARRVASPLLLLTGLGSTGAGQEAPMPDEQGKPQSDGHRALAISNAITRLHHEHYGRGPDQARTIIERNYVITFLDDVYTPVERTLIEAGEQASVRETRLAFQRAMKEKFSAAVEEVMGRKVIAFLSQVHFNPDISQETFVLEPEPDDRSPQAPLSEPVT